MGARGLRHSSLSNDGPFDVIPSRRRTIEGGHRANRQFQVMWGSWPSATPRCRTSACTRSSPSRRSAARATPRDLGERRRRLELQIRRPFLQGPWTVDRLGPVRAATFATGSGRDEARRAAVRGPGDVAHILRHLEQHRAPGDPPPGQEARADRDLPNREDVQDPGTGTGAGLGHQRLGRAQPQGSSAPNQMKTILNRDAQQAAHS
jgi:hypothetical protein